MSLRERMRLIRRPDLSDTQGSIDIGSMREEDREDVVKFLEFCNGLSQFVLERNIAQQEEGKRSIFVARDGFKIVGRVDLLFNEDRDRNPLIKNLDVLRPYRRKGIGTSLVSRCIDAARDRNCEAIEIDAKVNNSKAIRIYQKLGFKIVCINGFFRMGDSEFRMLREL